MLCTLCRKNYATSHNFVANMGRSVPVCASCLYKVQGNVQQIAMINVTQSFIDGNGITFVKKSVPVGIQGIDLSSIRGMTSGISVPVCTNCAMDFESVKKSGKLGCSECYVSFEKLLVPIVKKIHG